MYRFDMKILAARARKTETDQDSSKERLGISETIQTSTDKDSTRQYQTEIGRASATNTEKVNRKQLRFTCILNFLGKNLANTRDKAYEGFFPTVQALATLPKPNSVMSSTSS